MNTNPTFVIIWICRRHISNIIHYFPAGEGEMTTLTVPAGYTYTVSGDNVGGFIITVEVDK